MGCMTNSTRGHARARDHPAGAVLRAEEEGARASVIFQEVSVELPTRNPYGAAYAAAQIVPVAR